MVAFPFVDFSAIMKLLPNRTIKQKLLKPQFQNPARKSRLRLIDSPDTLTKIKTTWCNGFSHVLLKSRIWCFARKRLFGVDFKRHEKRELRGFERFSTENPGDCVDFDFYRVFPTIGG